MEDSLRHKTLVSVISSFATLGFLVFVGVIAAFFFATAPKPPKAGHHVAAVEWLPAAASDIHYYAKDDFIWWHHVADFRISEESFRAYAAAQEWQLREATNYAASLSLDLLGLHDASSTNRMGDMVPRALIYSKRYPNGGGTTVVFDRDKGRALYNASGN